MMIIKHFILGSAALHVIEHLKRNKGIFIFVNTTFNYDTVSEGERQNELFSGILLFGGFWRSNSEGLCVDSSQAGVLNC